MPVQVPTPGAVVQIRSTPWKVLGIKSRDNGYKIISCKGIAGLTKGKEASFVLQLEPSLKVLDPAEIELIADHSSGIIDTKLYLAASFRATPTTSRKPLTLGRAAIDDLGAVASRSSRWVRFADGRARGSRLHGRRGACALL